MKCCGGSADQHGDNLIEAQTIAAGSKQIVLLNMEI